MRRIALLALVLAAGVGIAGLVLGSAAEGSNSYSFNVIFDDARGLISGQLVKIAGARAGTITNVSVTPEYKARVEATITGPFHFHKDATCTIRPEGLIAENYVDCDPGTPKAPPLAGQDGGPPTVPVTQTSEPVSLLDLFNIFNLPTRERFMVIIDELGIGTAGRGADFNDILLRANPALKLARQAISILARQKSELASIVDATGRIASEGATHTGAVRSFINRAAALAQLTAGHTGNLQQSIARLPGLLAAAQPALQQLDTVARDGTPLLASLHAAVPYLNRVSSDIGPFAAVARPALAKLSTAIRTAIPAVRDVTPVVKTIVAYLNRSRGTTALFSKLAKNLQRHGFVENFLSTTYYIGAALARLDNTSHLLSILLVGPHNGLCGNYSTTPVPGCEAHYGTNPPYTPQRRGRSASASGANRRAVPAKTTAAAPAGTTAAPSGHSGGISLPSGAAGAVQQTGQTLQNLVNYLLK